MEKESKIILIIYLIVIAIIIVESVKSGYKTLSPFISEGTGHKVGWLLAAKEITLAWLVALVALARFGYIIFNKGLDKSVPRSIYGKTLRYIAVAFFVICLGYKSMALALATGIPYGWYAMMFWHIAPSFSLSVFLFEASRLYAFEENIRG